MTALLRLPPATRNAFALMTFFGNVAYVGYPVVTRAIPNSGATVSLVIATYSLTMFTLGIGSLEISRAGRLDLATVSKRIATNPFIIAIALGLIFSGFGVQLPEPVTAGLSMLGGAATPMVLMAIGVFLVRSHPMRGLFGKLLSLTVLRLGIIPAVAYLLVSTLPTSWTPHETGAIQVIEAAMPVGITTFALGHAYPVDRELAVAGIFVTTILSAVTLPLWLQALL